MNIQSIDQSTKTKISEFNLKITNEKSVEKIESVKKAPIDFSIPIIEECLFKREINNLNTNVLENQSILSIPSQIEETPYDKGLKKCCQALIEKFIDLIKTKIDPTFEFIYDKDSSILSLLNIQDQLTGIFYKKLPNDLKAVGAVIGNAVIDAARADPQKYITDSVLNSLISYMRITRQFLYSKELEEIVLEDFRIDLNNNENIVIPKEINSIINETIKKFTQIIREKAYPLFKVLVSNVPNDEKICAFRLYTKDKSMTYDHQIDIFENDVLQIAKIQTLINLLREGQESPTLLNWKKTSTYSNFCFLYFDDAKRTTIYSRHKKNLSNPTFVQNFFDIKAALAKLNKSLKSLGVLPIPKYGDWLQLPTVKQNVKNAPQKMHLPTIKKTLTIEPITEPLIPSKNEITIQEPLVQTPLIVTTSPSIITDIPNKLDTLVKEIPQIRTPMAVSEISPSIVPEIPTSVVPQIPNSVDDLEDESDNKLFESLRLKFEADRRKKFELKESKAKEALAAKKVLKAGLLEESSDLIPTDKNILSPKKSLSAKKQLMLEKVFAKKIENLEFSQKEIESLIRALGGKSEGAGGQYFHCYWGNSKKQGGIYEVVHGRDGKHYLKYEQILQVQEAIRTGLAFKTIPIELIPAHLLPIILHSEIIK